MAKQVSVMVVPYDGGIAEDSVSIVVKVGPESGFDPAETGRKIQELFGVPDAPPAEPEPTPALPAAVTAGIPADGEPGGAPIEHH